MSSVSSLWISKNKLLYEAILDFEKKDTGKLYIPLFEMLSYLDDLNKNGKLGDTNYTKRDLLNCLSDLDHYALFKIEKHHDGDGITFTQAYYENKKKLNDERNRLEIKSTNSDTDNSAEGDNTSSSIIYFKHKIDDYVGEDKKLVLALPDLLKLSIDIMNDPMTNWESRLLLSNALGYFFIEDDVIPYGEPFCYLDDLFLVTYVLELVKIRNRSLIINHWKGINIEDHIDRLYKDTKDILGNDVFRILSYVGLGKFFRENKELKARRAKTSSYSLNKERSELLGLLAYTINQAYDVNVPKKTQAYLKEKLQSLGEYEEIMRMILISKGELVPASKKLDDEILEQDLLMIEETLLLQDNDS